MENYSKIFNALPMNTYFDLNLKDVRDYFRQWMGQKALSPK